MWADWVSRMSGVASIVISFIAAYYELKDRGKPALWIAAAACYLVTSFTVWYKNRPELLIENQGVFLDTEYLLAVAEDHHVPQYITVMLYVVNQRPADNAIKSYELVVDIDGRKIVGRPAPTHYVLLRGSKRLALHEQIHSPLPQGHPTEGLLRFGFDREHDVKGRPFVLTVTDAYNVARWIKGTTPTELSDELTMKSLIPDAAYKS